MSQAKIDFLRHIVNRILAESKLPRQIVEDVRKSIGYAEEKYKFSAFGGDPRRLADYLRSRDFDDVVMMLRSAKADEVLVRILEEVKRRYSDIKEIVEAAEARLREIRGEAVESPESKIGLALNVLKTLEDRGLTVEMKDGKIVARLKGPTTLEATVVYDKDRKVYKMEFTLKGVVASETTSRIHDAMVKLIEVAKTIHQA